MTSSQEFTDAIRRLLVARIPVIVVKSSERQRVKRLLTEAVRGEVMTIYWHAPSTGFRELETNRSFSEEPSLFGALELAAQNFRTAQHRTFVFSDVQDLSSDTVLARHALEVTNLAAEHNGVIVVITDEPVWPSLQRMGMAVVLDPPGADEMEVRVRDTFAKYAHALPVRWSDAEYSQAGRILSGVTEIEADNLVNNLVIYGSEVGGIDIDALHHLTSSKDKTFSDLAGIERMPLHDMPSIGGLDNLRAWLEAERPFLTADYSDRHIGPPRGVMLVGVPGCGKSLTAKQIASSWDRPLYRLDLATVLGKWVGESEGQLRQALETADRVAPCVLWIDEIEKALSSHSSDSSGVTQRLLGQFLFWLQESTAPVFVAATANDVTNLPPELMRKGRFDELFFIDLPHDHERREIVHIHWNRFLPNIELSEARRDELVAHSTNFSGAEIESCIKSAAKTEIRMAQNGLTLDWSDIIKHFTALVPMSRTNPEQIRAIREWGIERARPATTPIASSAPSPRLVVRQ